MPRGLMTFMKRLHSQTRKQLQSRKHHLIQVCKIDKGRCLHPPECRYRIDHFPERQGLEMFRSGCFLETCQTQLHFQEFLRIYTPDFRIIVLRSDATSLYEFLCHRCPYAIYSLLQSVPSSLYLGRCDPINKDLEESGEEEVSVEVTVLSAVYQVGGQVHMPVVHIHRA